MPLITFVPPAADLSCKITQTIVTAGVASSQLVAANAARRYLAFQVIGAPDVTVVPGTAAAVAGSGRILLGNAIGKPGGDIEFFAGAPTDAFQCIAGAAGSTVVVWEGV